LAAVTRRAAALAALLTLACAAPIRSELLADDPPHGLGKLALEPFAIDMLATEVPAGAPRLVSARVADAIQSETNFRVVDSATQADAILTGVVRRYSERQGSSTGVKHPASVWIVLQLRDSDGRELWNGTYEETQAPLSEDMFSLKRAWDRGFRWVTAEELATYGARELVRELAREVATWS
jgi:hypothetical protein